jgi:hypothetical protein
MKEPPEREEFYGAPRLRWAALGVTLLLLWFARSDPEILVPNGVLGMVVVLLVFFVPPVTVTHEGVLYSRVFRLRWDEVRSASVRNVLGLQYLLVRRTRGLPWWISLDLTNGRSVKEALLLKSPPANPIREALALSPVGSGPVMARRSVLFLWLPLLGALGGLLIAGGLWLTWSPLLWFPDAPELTVLPASAPTPADEPSPKLTPVSVYGLIVGIPCDIAGEPSRTPTLTLVKCTNGTAVVVQDPYKPVFLPWQGESAVDLSARTYLARVAGTQQPAALMRAWLSMTPDALNWLTPPWAASTIGYLLNTKWVYLMGHRDLYEFSGNLKGFQFGSPDHGNHVELILFGKESAVYRLKFVRGPSAARFKQSEIFAVASSLRVAS